MQYDEIMEIVRTSKGEDWAHTGVSVLESWDYSESLPEKGKPAIGHLAPKHHHSLVVFKKDIDISIAWGSDHMEKDYHAPWKPVEVVFPDPAISSFLLDLRYRGQVIRQWVVVDFDGGRRYVLAPDPVPGTLDVAKGEAKWYVTKERLTYAWLFASLVRSGDRGAAGETANTYQRMGVEVREHALDYA